MIKKVAPRTKKNLRTLNPSRPALKTKKNRQKKYTFKTSRLSHLICSVKFKMKKEEENYCKVKVGK